MTRFAIGSSGMIARTIASANRRGEPRNDNGTALGRIRVPPVQGNGVDAELFRVGPVVVLLDHCHAGRYSRPDHGPTTRPGKDRNPTNVRMIRELASLGAIVVATVL